MMRELVHKMCQEKQEEAPLDSEPAGTEEPARIIESAEIEIKERELP